jgi:hypothetical protein
LKDSSAVNLLSHIIVYLGSNFYIGKKNIKGMLLNAQADDEKAFNVAVEDAIADRQSSKRSHEGKVGGGSLP